jgi:hypothetical protein
MRRIDQFSSSYLAQRLDYNPITGDLLWNPKRCKRAIDKSWNTRYAGRSAAAKADGRHAITKIDNISIPSHQIIWKMTFGDAPLNLIDHINRNGFDNRLCNLREATNSQNNQNRSVGEHSKSGHVGVTWYARDRCWRVQIEYEHLGYFDNLEDAITVRRKAEKDRWGEYAPTH